MNRLLAHGLNPLLLAAACILAVPSGASGHNADAGALFDCKDLRLPSQQEVARLSGIYNPGRAYAQRERMMQDVRRECLRGAQQVLVKAGDSLESLPARGLVEAR